MRRAEEFIGDVLKQEESRFKTTLERGLKLLDEETSNLPNGSELAGNTAFKLYDTYGFPLDLTQDILKKKQISVNVEEFEQNMLEQKVRARKSWAGSGEAKADNIWFDIKMEYGSTEFLGYTLDNIEGKIQCLIKDNVKLEKISEVGEKFILIVNQTPFYGESGGQMGDIGIIEAPSGKVKVIDTIKYIGSIYAHICELEEGNINIGENVKLSIDVDHRKNLKAHHSATHILHAVLREVLGKHVTQKGSLVAEDRLRFDFSHPKALSKEEIILIEDKVNKIITDNSKVNTVLMSADAAIEAGAMALFGEKYDFEVRVVSMGTFSSEGNAYSFELCGGTHVARTGDIGVFKITSESAIAAGVRRIEAVCGAYVLKIFRQNEMLLSNLADNLKSPVADVLDKVNTLIISKKELERELLSLKVGSLNLNNDQLEKIAIKINNCRLLYKLVDNMDAKILRQAAEQLSNRNEDLIIVYISKNEEKLSITIAVSKALSEKFHAGELAKEISIFLGGNGGGGQATLAQAGGVDMSKLTELPNKVEEILLSKM